LVRGEVIEVDCLWREEKVIIEIDGGAEHQTEAAFQADRARDRRLQALGWRTGRVTGAHMEQPEGVLADIRGMLAAATPNELESAIRLA
jgi:very-short-patch-repair endonuclease